MDIKKSIKITEINITFWKSKIIELQNKTESAEINLEREIETLKELFVDERLKQDR